MSAFSILALLALVASSQPDRAPCAAIPGAAALLTDRSVKTIVVGEMHGTNETPEAFADLVCLAAASGRRIVVALEHPTIEQPVFDRFMASDGGPAALLALTRSLEWHAPHPDGRTSVARLSLLRRLREMIARGQVARVVAVMPAIRLSSADYERAMAANVSHAGGHDELVFVLVGNVHAMLVPWQPGGGSSYLPMGADLPRASTRSLDATGNGGGAWVCMPDCGPHDLGPRQTNRPRGINLVAGEDRRYDGFLNLGVPTTVSPPAPAR